MRLKHIVVIAMITSLMLVSGCVQQDVAEVDSDGDGWSDKQELKAGTDPENKDTDSDGYWDPRDENPLDPEIPVPRVTPSPAGTVQPTPEPSPMPTPVPTHEFEITYPSDGGSVPRLIDVKGHGGEPGATIRIHVCTEEEGDRLRPNVGYSDEDGNWELEGVRIWEAKGYPMGEEAVIYGVMVVSEPGGARIDRSENITVFFK